MQNYLTCLIGLTSLCQNMIKSILSYKLQLCLLTRKIQLECNAVTNSQYSRPEKIELNPVPAEIHEGVLKESICKAL